MQDSKRDGAGASFYLLVSRLKATVNDTFPKRHLEQFEEVGKVGGLCIYTRALRNKAVECKPGIAPTMRAAYLSSNDTIYLSQYYQNLSIYVYFSRRAFITDAAVAAAKCCHILFLWLSA